MTALDYIGISECIGEIRAEVAKMPKNLRPLGDMLVTALIAARDRAIADGETITILRSSAEFAQQELEDMQEQHLKTEECLALANKRTEAAEARADAGVKVKPLVWEGFVSGNYYIEIKEGGLGHLWYYSAAIVLDEEPTLLKGGYLSLVSVDDLKAVAQADHDARIRSAIGGAL